MTEHYFSAHAGHVADALENLHDVDFSARGMDLHLKAGDRVFSGGRLDPGTAQLLAKAPPLPPVGTFLDLGCGWGPLAITMALESPDAHVWAVDVNERALALTRLNARHLRISTIAAAEADDAHAQALADDVRFDVIWSNPPIRVGKEALRALLLRWLDLLTPDGHAYLVVSKNLGADSLTTWLRESGYTADKLASRKGFRIIDVSRA